MKNERDCKIVQDLLPNYLENLTNEETNLFIDEHLKECEECQKQANEMKKDLELNKTESDGRKVKYFKKFGRKLKILKLIILVIVLIFVGRTARNVIILTNLSNRAEKLINEENYHATMYTYVQGAYSKIETFNMNGKRKGTILRTFGTDFEKITAFGTKINENEYAFEQYGNVYKETAGEKVVKLNQPYGISIIPYAPVPDPKLDFWDFVKCCVLSSIRSETYNGRPCYYINNTHSYMGASLYVDKETGLLVGRISADYDFNGTIVREPIYEFSYEFGTVTDADFVEPDITEYKVVESN